MGYSANRECKMPVRELIKSNPLAVMQQHPNYRKPKVKRGESLVEFTLRCAAHLVSPPQDPGEDYSLECVDVAKAIQMLAPEIQRAWELRN